MFRRHPLECVCSATAVSLGQYMFNELKVAVCGSRRNSRWANSALVVNVDERDWACLDNVAGMLPSTALQTEVERCDPSPHMLHSKLASASSFSGDVACRLFLRSALLCKDWFFGYALL